MLAPLPCCAQRVVPPDASGGKLSNREQQMDMTESLLASPLIRHAQVLLGNDGLYTSIVISKVKLIKNPQGSPKTRKQHI